MAEPLAGITEYSDLLGAVLAAASLAVLAPTSRGNALTSAISERLGRSAALMLTAAAAVAVVAGGAALLGNWLSEIVPKAPLRLILAALLAWHAVWSWRTKERIMLNEPTRSFGAVFAALLMLGAGSAWAAAILSIGAVFGSPPLLIGGALSGFAVNHFSPTRNAAMLRPIGSVLLALMAVAVGGSAIS